MFILSTDMGKSYENSRWSRIAPNTDVVSTSLFCSDFIRKIMNESLSI